MRLARAFAAFVTLILLGACSLPGPGQAPDGIWDPYESGNRRVHAFNRSVDKAVLSGAGQGASQAVPVEVQDIVLNMADTLSLPRTVANQVLQLRLGRATKNTLRFALNATLGLAGIADVATGLGLPHDESDFGETLHVWGLPEGAYVELPLIGPSTERDAVGQAVDLFLNPLDYALSRHTRYWKTGIWVAGEVVERGRYDDTYDQVLHESADSYSQLRLIYLQNRRYELGGGTGDASAADDTFIDPTAIDTEGF